MAAVVTAWVLAVAAGLMATDKTEPIPLTGQEAVSAEALVALAVPTAISAEAVERLVLRQISQVTVDWAGVRVEVRPS